MGFVELIFASLIRMSALNPKSRHYVTLAKPRAFPVRRANAFIKGKVDPLARITLPPRRVGNPNVNDWLILPRNKLKVTSA